jgi:threonine dehydrogenase-like Zn-dependent dehydrogenase
MCVNGWPLLCLHRDDPHPGEGGGWSEQFVRHESQLMRIPDDITDEQAVLLDPLGSAAHAVLRRPPAAHERVIVIGCGAIGLSMILSLRALATEVKIIALARYPFQSEHARAMGADEVLSGEARELYPQLAQALETEVLAAGRTNQLLHHGADVVYDAVGNGESLHHALRWTRPRGTVVVEGINPHPATLDRSAIWLRELEILGAHGHGRENYQGKELHTFELVLGWIREKRIKPDALITHRFPLREYRSAIRIAEGKACSSATKVLLELCPDG